MPANVCWICGLDLKALQYNSTAAERLSLDRQIGNGMCDSCQRLRQAAAVEYEAACAEVRMMQSLGADRFVSFHRNFHPAMRQALNRVETADRRAVALKMWPADRTPSRPYRHYREEP